MRNRTHILEEKSFDALKRLFPDQWVVRDKSKDYGIDAEVEIFDKKGNPTGLVFWVQLKATDSERATIQKSIRMPIVKIRQLSKYDLPVAIFRYSSVANSFVFDWIKRHAFLSSNLDSKSFNIHFSENNIWNDQSAKDVISFLQIRERLREGKYSFPLKAYINNVYNNNGLRIALRSIISQKSDTIKLVRDSSNAILEINLLRNRVVLNFHSLYGSSIGLPDLSLVDDSERAEKTFKGLNTALTILLSLLNKPEQLLHLIERQSLIEDIINHPDILRYLMPILFKDELGEKFSDMLIEHIMKSKEFENRVMLQLLFLSKDNRKFSKQIDNYYKKVIEVSSDFKD